MKITASNYLVLKQILDTSLIKKYCVLDIVQNNLAKKVE